MYAIIQDGGRQLQVEEGQEIDVDYRDASRGDPITFDRVLAYRDDDGFLVGQPTLEGAAVTGEVVGPKLGPKVVVQKLRKRKTYRRKTGHRQLHTRVKIDKILKSGFVRPDEHATPAEEEPASAQKQKKTSRLDEFMKRLQECDILLAARVVSLDIDDFNHVIDAVHYKQPPSDPKLLEIYSKLRRYVDEGKLPATGY